MFVPLTGPKSPGKMGMANFRKGDPNFFRPKPFRRGPYFEKVTFSFFSPPVLEFGISDQMIFKDFFFSFFSHL